MGGGYKPRTLNGSQIYLRAGQFEWNELVPLHFRFGPSLDQQMLFTSKPVARRIGASIMLPRLRGRFESAMNGCSDAMLNTVPAIKHPIQVKKEQKMKNPTAIAFQFTRALGAIGLAVLSSGCLATGSPNTFFEVTVRPGSSELCLSDPCTVYFETPAGSGTHNILQNGTIKAGVAIGGQRVSLGVYSNESLVFHVEGTDLPVAYLTVVGSP